MIGMMYPHYGDEPKPDNGRKTHAIDGPKKKFGDGDGRNQPIGSGSCELIRSHAEVEVAKIREPELGEGLSCRMGMGDMDHAIDDGKNY